MAECPHQISSKFVNLFSSSVMRVERQTYVHFVHIEHKDKKAVGNGRGK